MCFPPFRWGNGSSLSTSTNAFANHFFSTHVNKLAATAYYYYYFPFSITMNYDNIVIVCSHREIRRPDWSKEKKSPKRWRRYFTCIIHPPTVLASVHLHAMNSVVMVRYILFKINNLAIRLIKYCYRILFIIINISPFNCNVVEGELWRAQCTTPTRASSHTLYSMINTTPTDDDEMKIFSVWLISNSHFKRRQAEYGLKRKCRRRKIWENGKPITVNNSHCWMWIFFTSFLFHVVHTLLCRNLWLATRGLTSVYAKEHNKSQWREFVSTTWCKLFSFITFIELWLVDFSLSGHQWQWMDSKSEICGCLLCAFVYDENDNDEINFDYMITD